MYTKARTRTHSGQSHAVFSSGGIFSHAISAPLIIAVQFKHVKISHSPVGEGVGGSVGGGVGRGLFERDMTPNKIKK